MSRPTASPTGDGTASGGHAADREQLLRAIDAQEGLRGVVPDDVVDAAVAALRRQLDGPVPDAQRRRQVTVLFADVSGFTSMSSQLDHEALAGVMNQVWSRLDRVITDGGGRIDKHIGDAVMAVWGVTSTREDDPERAVRAALAMQDELTTRAPVDGLVMRVGINTGPAHLGAVGTGAEFTAMGDTVNVASRIQNLSPLGGVLVTHDTYRHVRGVFDVEELPAAEVKGKDEPIRTYVVHRAKAHAFRMPSRGVEGVETRMVGRADELAALQDAFESVVAEPRARAVAIVGEAGIGKSRLLYEFENWIDLHPADAYFFKGRALATRQSAAFGLARDMFGDRFGVLDSDAPSAVAAKLHAGMAPALSAGEAEVVGQWLGFELRSSEAVRRLLGGELAATARAHLVRYLESLAAESAVVVFLEDLHWADDESLALVSRLVEDLADLRVLIVGAARPAVRDRPAGAGVLAACPVTLELDPLGADAVRRLVDEVLQKAGPVADELADLIVSRADGNAFYVEELVKMLIEDGVIEIGDEWQIHVDRLDAARVPATLTGVLQARLDGLGPDERDALQRSSVVGRVFWNGAVATLGAHDVDTTTTSLEAAREREFVYRRDQSSFDDNVEYVFRHALLRDVTYETVLLRDRQRLHRLVADWIRDHAGERLVEYAGLMATHLRLAGDPAAAAELLCQGAAAALASGRSAGARDSLEEALGLWAESGEPVPVGALIVATEACLRTGDYEAAANFSTEAQARAETQEDRVRALFFASWIASDKGDRARERELLDAVLPEAERVGGMWLGRVLCGLVWSDVGNGDPVSARAHLERAAELAAGSHDRTLARGVAGLRPVLADLDGDGDAMLAFSADALEESVAAGDLEGQALAQDNLGVARHLRGEATGEREDYVLAIEHYEASRALNRRLGHGLRTGMTTANIAQAYVRLGDDGAARRHLIEAFRIVQRSGNTSALTFLALAEADRRLAVGDVDSGLEIIGAVQRLRDLRAYDEGEIERILSHCPLPDDVVAAGVARGADLDFDGLVARIERDLAAADASN